MQKMLGALAAAFILSVGSACASTVTINVSFSGTKVNCPFTVTQSLDKKRSITNAILLSAGSASCAFYGEGLMAKAVKNRAKPASLTSIATLSGYNAYAAQYLGYQAIQILFQVSYSSATGAFKFKNGDKYWVYGTTYGTDQHYIGNGTYAYTP